MRPRPARKAFARGRRLAKRPPDVQQSGGFFPALGTACRGEKSRRNPAAFFCFRAIGGPARSEPPVAFPPAMVPAAVTIVVMIPVATHATMLEAVVPPALAEPALHMRQDSEAA